MGCWNETCGISQMPITRGERIVLFPLRKNNKKFYGGGFSNSTDMYTPISIPIKGEYNEYGGIVNVDRSSLIVFNQIVPLLELDKFEFKKEMPKTIEELILNIERKDIENMGFMMVHEEIFERMIEEIGKRKPYGRNNTLKELYEKSIISYIERMKYLSKEKSNSWQYMFDEELCNNPIKEFFTPTEMMFALEELPNQKDEVMITDILDFILFSIAMTFSRKAWTIQTGTGSQNEEYYLHKIIGECILAKELDVRNKYKEEYCDYENIKDSLTRETVFFFD